MDAVKFFKEQTRMCTYFKCCCSRCPIEEESGHSCFNTDIDTRVKVVEKWSKEHPAKTRMSEFLKKYPYSRMTQEKVPMFFPCDIDTRIYESGNCVGQCTECREKYWKEEIE